MDIYFETTSGTGDEKISKLNMRKIKKPLMEKRRRDRINRSLTHLKTLLLDNIRSQGGRQTSKLLKADILEMTVNYMKMLQHEHSLVTMSTELQYNIGYQACARQAMRCLNDDLFSTDKSQSASDSYSIISNADDNTRMRENIQFAIPQMPFRTSTPMRVYQALNNHTSQYPGILQYNDASPFEDQQDITAAFGSSSSFNEHIEEEDETAADTTIVTDVTYSYIKQEVGVHACTKGELIVWRPW